MSSGSFLSRLRFLRPTMTTFLPFINTSSLLSSSVLKMESPLNPMSIAIRSISTTPALLAEPLKKKKKMDPAVIKAREARKLRKLEKSIRRLERNSRQLKPLDELQVPTCITDQPKIRQRPLPQHRTEEVEGRWQLQKQMTKFKFEQSSIEFRYMERLLKSQDKALQELEKVSKDLHSAAVDVDLSFIPYESKGPVETPPNPSYSCPEGDYIDISRKWE